MNVLVIGSGGREHAIVRALTESKTVSCVFCTPSSDAIQKSAEFFTADLNDNRLLEAELKEKNISLVVIGPEAPLVEGLADRIQKLEIPVFGPSLDGAKLEASKIYAKEFMKKAEVPTAQYFKVNSVESTLSQSQNFQSPWVLKANGLAAGKGVFICKTQKELEDSAKFLFEAKGLGDSGSEALLEEYLPGWELSFLVLTNGEEFEALPLAQDHKRLLDGDAGPNTGGMGAVAPVAIDEELSETILTKIVKPSVDQLNTEKIHYRGVLYIGIMVTESGPSVLEYNVRFGDPETQILLPLLDGDWGSVFQEVANGKVPKLNWKKKCSSVVVMASEGYPESPKKNVIVKGDVFFKSENSYFLHAGTRFDPLNGWVTNGGRVLNAIGIGDSVQESLDAAYDAASKVQWDGVQIRKDIGKRQINEETE